MIRLGVCAQLLVATVALVCAAACARAPRNPLLEACLNYGLSDDERVDNCSALLAGEATAEERARALETRGYTYYRNHKLDQAIADYDGAVALDAELDPHREHRASLFYNRGRIRAERGEHAAAIEDFQRAAAINVSWSDPLSWSAKIKLRNLGDRVGALSDIEAALRRSPEDEDLLRLRCEILVGGAREDATAAACPGG